MPLVGPDSADLTGEVVLLSAEQVALRQTLQKQFLAKHPAAKKYINEFDFYLMHLDEVRYWTGNETKDIPVSEYLGARVDVLAPTSRSVLDFMNSSHAEDLRAFCKEYANTKVDVCFMYTVDRLGFNLLGMPESTNEWIDFRMPFPFEMASVEECKPTLLDAIDKLRKKAVPLDPAAVQQAILRGYQPSEKMRSEEWFNEINSK